MSSESHETMLLSCNNGAITGWSVGWENNSFTSRLNVSVTSNIFGKDIVCAYDDRRGKSVTIGSFTLIQNILGCCNGWQDIQGQMDSYRPVKSKRSRQTVQF